MKLRTKFQDEDFELGEVVDADVTTTLDDRIILQAVAKAGGLHTIFYDKIEKLYDEWEDAPEESKAGYIIDPMDEDCVSTDDDWGYETPDIERAKELGIWFETEEEAEEAVEKLKAWKRLKDKCFRFYRWNKGSILESKPNAIEFACDDTRPWSWEDIRDDLDLLFGGEG